MSRFFSPRVRRHALAFAPVDVRTISGVLPAARRLTGGNVVAILRMADAPRPAWQPGQQPQALPGVREKLGVAP